MCPEDPEAWEKAKKEKQCQLVIHNCTKEGELQYHCLPNKELDMLVEVCAISRFIVGNIKMSISNCNLTYDDSTYHVEYTQERFLPLTLINFICDRYISYI